MRTHEHKILSDIWTRKGRTLLVSLSIFFGVFGVIALQSMTTLLTTQLNKDIQQERLAMQEIVLRPKPEQTLTTTDELLATIEEQPNVTVVEGEFLRQVYFKPESEAEFEQGFMLASTSAPDQVMLEPWRMVEGEYPMAGQREIVIDERTAERYALGVGDTLTLQLVAQSTGDNIPEETWTISGIIFYAYQNLNLETDRLMVVNLSDAQYLAGFEGLTGINIRYTDFASAEANAEMISAQIGQTTSYIPLVSRLADPEQNQQLEGTRTLGAVMTLFAFTALLVSGFLVINVINSIIVEQKRLIGVMKSLGATRLETIYIYSGISLGYGILAVIPGVLLGVPAGFLISQGIAPMLGTSISEFAVSPSAIVIGVIVGLAVPLLASLLPVYNGTRVNILEAMTDLGITSHFGSGWLDRLIARIPLPISIRQGISNVSQKKSRLALTMFTLAVAVGAFMGIFAVFSSLTGTINGLFDTFNAQIYLSPTEPQDLATVEELLSEVESIESIQPSGFLQVQIEQETVEEEMGPAIISGTLMLGIDPEQPISAFALDIEEGTSFQDSNISDGVVISSALAETYDKQVGDTLVVVGAGNRQSFPIIGIADYAFEQLWVRWETMAAFQGNVVDGNPVVPGFAIILKNADADGIETDAAIKEINHVLIQNGITADYQNFPDFLGQITQQIQGFQVIASSATLLIAAVGALGLLTTLYMSVFERQKEIGIMRSIGANSLRIVLQFLIEGIIVGIIAWVIGIPISILLSNMIETAMNLGERVPFQFSPEAAVVGGIGMIIGTFIASILPSLSAAQKTVSNILRYQ